mgnify:CR=1 FL=1
MIWRRRYSAGRVSLAGIQMSVPSEGSWPRTQAQRVRLYGPSARNSNFIFLAFSPHLNSLPLPGKKTFPLPFGIRVPQWRGSNPKPWSKWVSPDFLNPGFSHIVRYFVSGYKERERYGSEENFLVKRIFFGYVKNSLNYASREESK